MVGGSCRLICRRSSEGGHIGSPPSLSGLAPVNPPYKTAPKPPSHPATARHVERPLAQADVVAHALRVQRRPVQPLQAGEEGGEVVVLRLPAFAARAVALLEDAVFRVELGQRGPAGCGPRAPTGE